MNYSISYSAYQIFANSEALILNRAKTIKADKEKSTILKPLSIAKSKINDPQFQAVLQFVNNLMNGQKKFLQLQEIRTLLLYVGSKFNIDTGRALQKYKEAQVLSLAVFFESWWPFLESAEIQKCKASGQHNIILTIPEGKTFVDKNMKTVILHAQKVEIPVNNYKNARELLHDEASFNSSPEVEMNSPQESQITFEPALDFSEIQAFNDWNDLSWEQEEIGSTNPFN